MEGYLIILYLLFSHFVADFLFQTTYMGTMKSKSVAVLIFHTFVYTIIMLFMLTFAGKFWIPEFITYQFLWFYPVTFVVHTIQDFATSYLTSSQFEEKNYNGLTGAFTIIGFDQFLHYCQIFVTIYYLTKPI